MKVMHASIAALFVAAIPQSAVAAGNCSVPIVPHQDMDETMRVRAMSIFQQARSNDAADREALSSKVNVDAQFEAWSADDNVTASGKGMSGLLELASVIPAHTYRYYATPGIITTWFDPCGSVISEFELVDPSGQEIWNIEIRFMDGRVTSGKAWRQFAVTGDLAEVAK